MQTFKFKILMISILVMLLHERMLKSEVFTIHSQDCVQIYYDSVPQEKSGSPHKYFGLVHAIHLQNLLGHFPHLQQYLLPIEAYQAGDIDRCKASFYLGTYFDNDIPAAFYFDYVHTKKNVVWAGYNIWHLEKEVLESLWKVSYASQTGLDFDKQDRKGRPGFFKNYTYHGEVFVKYGDWHRQDKKRFMAAFEISRFKFAEELVKPFVKSWAIHSTSSEKIPYILQNGNHWYIGDSPFSYMTEEDRYLIFSDLLFDILQEEPLHKGKKPALFRIEDIHPQQPLWQMYRLTDMLQRKGIPYAIAIIPIFSDPFGSLEYQVDTFLPILGNQPFLDFLAAIKPHKPSYIFHGVTHQLGHMRNPYNAMSGDDFEFWDIVQGKPVATDTPEWIIKRLQDGYALLQDAGLSIQAWEVPHYQASPLAYTIFAQVFSWNIGRITYFPHSKDHWTRLSPHLVLNQAGIAANALRLNALKNLQVSYIKELLPSGQFFPYEIFGDIYDHRLIPENVGNFEPYFGAQAPAPRTVDDLLKVVRRNRVLRDVWASFFMHAHLLGARWQEGLGDFPGDTRELERFIDGVREAGYEFINLSDYTQKFFLEKRNPTRTEF